MSDEEPMPRMRTARESDLDVAFKLFRERTDQRLGQGAVTMAELRQRVDELAEEIDNLKPKPRPVWPLVTFGFVAITALCGWVWQMARYPDRSEFERMEHALRDRITDHDARLANFAIERERLGAAINELRLQVERRKR